MHSVPRAERFPNILFGLVFIILAVVSATSSALHGGAINLIDDVGLLLLGIALIVLKSYRLSRITKCLFVVIVLAVFVNLGLLNGRLVVFIGSSLVSFYLFYKFLKVSFGKRPAPKVASMEATPKPEEFLKDDDAYQPYVSCKAYLEREVGKSILQRVISTNDCAGVETRLGPLVLQHFATDVEPPAGKDGPLRLVIWQPIREPKAETGWRTLKTQQFFQMTGFTHLDLSRPYTQTWSPHARRHLKTWQKQTAFEIVHPSIQEFIDAYRKSDKPFVLKRLFIRSLKKIVRKQKGHVICWGVKRRVRSEAPLEAGFVALDVPEAKMMQHFISFIHPGAKDSGAGVALMDAWFAEGVKLKRDVMDFGTFWYPGDPIAWKGFSRFKSQFNITYVRYPHQRLKLAGSWKKLF